MNQASPENRPKLPHLTQFGGEFVRHLTGRGEDRLMRFATRSATLAIGGLAVTGLGIYSGNDTLVAVGLVAVFSGGVTTRILSGAAIIRAGDPLDWFPRS